MSTAGSLKPPLVETRHWLTNVSRRHLLGEQDLLARYRAFRTELPILAADFDLILEGWLESRPVART
jgi:hypothetical protein